ncbi:MAG: diaminopimelate dehydrogenase [Anaerovoracaceae bacterium]|nr:diaminopimelate dehydrogenase [Anaerovoracaceae bacterium]
MRVAIAGYGNLGRGAEAAVTQAEDMELTGIFTRRDPSAVRVASGTAVYSFDDMDSMKDDIDVMIICGGSATDLPVMTPELVSKFNVVDSFDTHANIPQHYANVDAAAKASGHIGVISAGWDPGLFSLARVFANAALPCGNDYTFWGRGVSQGHSDAIRRIEGVKDARQYTVPVEDAVSKVLSGEQPELTTREKHTRECYVVAEDGADLAAIENAIKTMPNYFDEYDTTVTFISEDELKEHHSGLPHGGQVIRSGRTGWEREYHNSVRFMLDLDSNPFFTSSILTACARAAYRMSQNGETGARTMLEIPPILLLPQSADEVRAHLL